MSKRHRRFISWIVRRAREAKRFAPLEAARVAETRRKLAAMNDRQREAYIHALCNPPLIGGIERAERIARALA